MNFKNIILHRSGKEILKNVLVEYLKGLWQDLNSKFLNFIFPNSIFRMKYKQGTRILSHIFYSCEIGKNSCIFCV